MGRGVPTACGMSVGATNGATTDGGDIAKDGLGRNNTMTYECKYVHRHVVELEFVSG